MRPIGALLFSSFLLVTFTAVDLYGEDHISAALGEEIAVEVQIEEGVMDVSS